MGMNNRNLAAFINSTFVLGENVRELGNRVNEAVAIVTQTQHELAVLTQESAAFRRDQENENANLRLHIDRTNRNITDAQNQRPAPTPNVNNREIKKDTFPSLDFSEENKKSFKDWCEWRNGVELVFLANPYLRQRNIDELVAAIIRDLGKGRKYTQTTIQADETTHTFGFQDLEEFYEKLKTWPGK